MKKYVNNSFVNKSPLEYKNGTEVVTSLPVTLYTDGQPVSSYTIKGNTETSETPSPSNPITISGCGDKTANLLPTNIAWYLNNNASAMDKSDVSDIRIKTDVFPVSDTNAYLTVGGFNLPNIDGLYLAAIRFYGDDLTTPLTTSGSGNTRAIPTGAKWASLLYGTNSTTFDTSTIKSQMQAAQLTAIYGQTAPSSYIPYGYKISILSNQTALSPIYLSQQLMRINAYDTSTTYVKYDNIHSNGTATYNIRKLVFTGEEDWGISGGVFWLGTVTPDYYRLYNGVTYICTHYESYKQHSTATNTPDGCIAFGYSTQVQRIYLHDSTYTTVQDFQTYLATQYAAGTPVTVYYVLATAETESVTAPSIPTTGGEATIDIDTTVKPSEMVLTYHGWHEHEPLKRENGQWV